MFVNVAIVRAKATFSEFVYVYPKLDRVIVSITIELSNDSSNDVLGMCVCVRACVCVCVCVCV